MIGCHMIVVVVLAIVAGPCLAHVGHLHDYPELDPIAQNWSYVSVGSCSKWSKVTAQKASLLLSGRRLEAAASNTTKDTATVDVASLSTKGTAEVVVYLFRDCKDATMSGIRANMTISSGTKPAGNITITGIAHTGSCGANGGSTYLLNASAPDADENQLLINTKDTHANGTIIGTAGVEAVIKTGKAGVNSLVLFYDDTPFSCCDLDIADPGADYAAPLAKKGKNCTTTEVNVVADGENHNHKGTDTTNTTTRSTNPDQIGMFMDGTWMPCTTQVDGKFYMTHGGAPALCTEYQNGTRISSTATTGTNATGTNTTHNHSAAPAVRAGSAGALAAVALVVIALVA